MVRTSSPGRYSRTSSNSIPSPLKAEWYCPAKRSLTIAEVTIWMRRTFLSMSAGITVASSKFLTSAATSTARGAAHIGYGLFRDFEVA